MENKINYSKPQFNKNLNEEVFQLLRKDVLDIVATLAPKRMRSIRVKAVLFPLVYIALWFVAMVFGGEDPYIFYGAYFGLGFMIVTIFLNIIHDAVHGTIFKQKHLNELFVYLFDLIGANSFIWRQRHVRFHHNYPNVDGWDTDIERSALVRIFPASPLSKFHPYQHIYLPFIYPLFLFNWLLIRDFRDFFNAKKTVRKLVHLPVYEYVKLFIFKSFFFFYLIVFPVLYMGISWAQAFSGFLIMVMTASVYSLIVLLPPHANVHSAFPLPDVEKTLPQNWFMHMLMTTNDVEEDNWFTRFFMGCFNYHVVHHLFPNVHHVYYPEITEKLRAYALTYQLPYRRLPLLKALYAHFQLLKKNTGRNAFDIWEESM